MADNKIRLTDEKPEKEYTYQEIVDMMKIAKTQNRLADLLGVDPDTVTNTKKRDKRFSDAIAQGKREWTKPVIEKLIEIAHEKGDIGAIKYILNNVEPDDWSDKTKQEVNMNTNISLSKQLADTIESNARSTLSK